ncbi:hypothetical protein [Radiobacillus sp. PE A8.2]|uniref:hypothetical protein n=1 Tax=Radiobacillus sp. PE A8.2 TaxID=3380349 RepID=UPI00388DDBFB
MDSHPDITVDKKTDSLDENKSVHDTKALILALKFFKKHLLIIKKNLVGDTTENATTIYKTSLQN